MINDDNREITKLEVKKQYKNIDVFVIINDKYGLVIEDKTNTSLHSDQLNRYRETVKANYASLTFKGVYYKMIEQSIDGSIEKAGKNFLPEKICLRY